MVTNAGPLRHGRWIPHRIASSSMCSECKKYAAFETPYCPHCGARMDADEIAKRRAAADDYAEY